MLAAFEENKITFDGTDSVNKFAGDRVKVMFVSFFQACDDFGVF
jgi:hypothetical protein